MNQISKLPKTEQQLFNIEREYDAVRGQFELLLEKRAEAGILQASNLPDTKVIDKAYDLGQQPVGPNRSRNIALALVLGVLIPVVVFIIRDLANNRIMSLNHVESITDIPIIGSIGHSKHQGNLAVFSHPESSVSESFRALRANLDFFLKPVEKEGQVVLVTSSIGGEGKTFNAINTASVISLGQKKTCLVGVDLRKPKIFNDFDLFNEEGVSTFLSGQSKELTGIIQKTKYEYLDIISAGPVPPNPSELLSHPRFEALIEDLRKKYDYIIVDSPPMGLVSDSILISKLVDITLYVCRFNYSQKKLLDLVNDHVQVGKMQNVGIVLNDISQRNSYGYGYGYDYAYGYGYGYGYGFDNHEG
jgi:capsular exopolysaccharide synthesis family protein